MPMVAERAFEVSDILVYLPRPGKDVRHFIPAIDKELPISKAWISLNEAEEGLDMNGIFTCGTEQDARAFSIILKLLILSWERGYEPQLYSKVFSGARVDQENNKVYIVNNGIPRDVLLDTFFSILIY